MTTNLERLERLIAPGNADGGFIVHGDQPVTCGRCGTRTEWVDVPEFTLERNAQVHTCLNPDCKHEFATCDDVFELPDTLDTVQAIVGVFFALVEYGYPRISDDDPEAYDDADDYRVEYDDCLGDALRALGIAEPEGMDLDWLRHIHDAIDERLPNLTAFITE